MHLERELASGLYWIGGDDRRLGSFEALHPVPEGMSYNTYLLLDEKAVLFDTIDRAVEERFLETLEHLLEGRHLDYIIVNHAEPDHSATLGEVARRNPEAQLVCTSFCKTLIEQFFGKELAQRTLVVGDGDTLSCGKRTLSFFTAPMVHWPEVMVTYDAEDATLFSADAFGTFGALDGRLFDSGYASERELLAEMRRYYANIIGKYGTQVDELLAKVEKLNIKRICPLHGPILQAHISEFIKRYRLWASYEPEAETVMIAYASIYGGTRDVAEALAFKLSERGVKDLSLFDLSMTDPSYVLSEVFRVSNIVLASVTYNAGMFPKMSAFIDELSTHNVCNRRVSLIQNGSWGPNSGALMREGIEKLESIEFVGDTFTIRSRMTDDQDAELDALADAIFASLDESAAKPATGLKPQSPLPAGKIPIAPNAHGLAGGPAEAPRQGSEQPVKIVQVWRCTFCGYQAEVPKGTDMSTFVCPVCFKTGPGRFMLIREKVVPV